MAGRKEWMLGIPGHNELVSLEDVLLLVRGGQVRPTDLVKKLGEPWRAANEMPDLVDHFIDAPLPRTPMPEPSPAAPPDPPARRTTERVPKAAAAKPAEASRSIPRVDARPARAAFAPPVKEERKTSSASESKPPPSPSPPSRSGTRPPPPTRPIPKPAPPPVRRMDPMVEKYYSPVDLLRSASFAFEPKKLLLASTAAPLGVLWSIGMYRAQESTGVAQTAILLVANVVFVFGLAVVLTALAYATRRQLEAKPWTFVDAVQHTVGNLSTALVYPVVVLLPSLASLGVLWLLGLARDASRGGAAALKVGYLLPMIFAFLAVLGSLVVQVASMYVPAAGAIEGAGLRGSMSLAWDSVRRQWGRVVLHWLIVTVACGVITGVSLGLAEVAIRLPEAVFGPPEDGVIADAWNQFDGLFAVYRGMAYGLGLMLPVSLFSTLATLSYVSLRHPATAALSHAALMDETSGIGIPMQGRGAATPMEATSPAETRPAPPDATRPGGTPVPDISDDSDEQPLVKE